MNRYTLQCSWLTSLVPTQFQPAIGLKHDSIAEREAGIPGDGSGRGNPVRLVADDEPAFGRTGADAPAGLAPAAAADLDFPGGLHRPAECRLCQAADAGRSAYLRGELRLRRIAVLSRLCDVRGAELPRAATTRR